MVEYSNIAGQMSLPFLPEQSVEVPPVPIKQKLCSSISLTEGTKTRNSPMYHTISHTRQLHESKSVMTTKCPGGRVEG